MKNCNGCKYAKWHKTEKGRLHPSGDGKCTYAVTIPVIPACMSWGSPPRTTFPHINRREELKDHCPCYQPEDKK